MEFKIGDKVICIGESSGGDGDATFGGYGWKKDLIFKITRITTTSYTTRGKILWGDNTINKHGVWDSHVKLYERKIKEYGISKFINSINKK
jgi:hypothetical protein